jgi:hypothetical protein
MSKKTVVLVVGCTVAMWMTGLLVLVAVSVYSVLPYFLVPNAATVNAPQPYTPPKPAKP